MDATHALGPAEAASLLRSALTIIAAEGAAASEQILRWRPAPGEWCIKEVLGHLIEAERRGFAGRIRIIVPGDTPELDGWDPDEVSRKRRDDNRSWAELIGEFTALREDALALVRGLEPAHLEKAGRHPKVGLLRVSDLLHEWVHHDRNHVKQMLANVQGAAWPHMGNAQKFSAPASARERGC